MPTYDYVCDACGHEFELFQPITAEPEKKCPKCKKKKLRRLIGAGAAIMFKGSGFYKTDYRSDAYNKSAAADKPSESKPAETKSEGGSKSDGGSKSEGGKSDSGKSSGGGKSEGSGKSSGKKRSGDRS